jgi:hypothetical protein
VEGSPNPESLSQFLLHSTNYNYTSRRLMIFSGVMGSGFRVYGSGFRVNPNPESPSQVLLQSTNYNYPVDIWACG